MDEKIPKRYLFIIYGFIAVLVLTLALLTLALLGDAREFALSRAEYGRHIKQITLHTKARPGAGEVSQIASWMTFDYISAIYGIPGTYLAHELDIAMPLPHQSLAKYARVHRLDPVTFVRSVKSAAMKYFATPTVPGD